MEKQNQVTEKKTPCSVCQGGYSEFVCASCLASKRASAQDRLNPEAMEGLHNELRR